MRFFTYILIILFTFSAQQAFSETQYKQIQDLLENRIKEVKGKPVLSYYEDEVVYSRIVLPQFYKQNDYKPIWITPDGLKEIISDMVAEIKHSRLEGLNPEDYHLSNIESLLKMVKNDEVRDVKKLVELELLLTDAFLILGSHYVEGKVNPETFDANWFANRRQADMKSVLQEAINEQKIRKSLQNLLPTYPEYTYLRQALSRYQTINENGGWPVIPPGPVLRKGDYDERVPLLHKRLVLSGDYNRIEKSKEDLFNDTLEEAVISFQIRHGLEADGIVGPNTIAELNTTVEHRLEQVVINMERWRWLPQNLGQRYIIVNIANFEVDVVENNETVLTTDAVVGRQYRKTPVFTSNMSYLVFSPYWHVPPGIKANDIIPEVKKDIGYLKRRNLKILSSWGEDAKVINPSSINWSKISARNFPYRIRQDPGPDNALGQVKFMFPNRFNVYMHDTPDKELFGKTRRDFSSGCIRINKPVELSQYLLRDRPDWTKDAILAAMNTNSERTVTLRTSIPVHILYWTAWAGEDSTIQFRNDIYNRDPGLLQALKSPATQSTQFANINAK